MFYCSCIIIICMMFWVQTEIEEWIKKILCFDTYPIDFSRISLVYWTVLNYEISELFASTLLIVSRNFESYIFCSEKAGFASRFNERPGCRCLFRLYTLVPSVRVPNSPLSSFKPAIHLFRLYKIAPSAWNNSWLILSEFIKLTSFLFLSLNGTNQIMQRYF